MRVLLVEDKSDFARTIEVAAEKIPDVEVVWCKSRDGAIEKLSKEFFDLVILDRRVPSIDEDLDDNPEHGWYVFQRVRDRHPGTPVWFLTGTAEADFAAEINNDHSCTRDLHGKGQLEQLYMVFWKKDLVEVLKRLRNFASERSAVDRIAVNFPDGVDLELTPAAANIVRQYGRRHQGASVDLASLNGGLSSARVLKVVVRDSNGAERVTSVGKVSRLEEIHDEQKRYENEIVRLTPGGAPQLTLTIDAGGGDYGGMFYRMVGDVGETLFDRLVANHPALAEVPALLRGIEAPWYVAKQVHSTPVSKIRRKLLGDTRLDKVRNELGGIDIAGIESRAVQTAHCAQHGDLHCANVVFTISGQPMLIDFGAVGPSFSAIDPITLELCTLFHPQHSRLPVGWPTEDQMANWVDVAAFTVGCSFAPFIYGSRAWAIADAGSTEEVVATAYAFAIRQLSFPNTNKVLARALIKACISKLVG